MRIFIVGGGLNFCDKVVCGDEVFCELPVLVESYFPTGRGEVFIFSDSKARCFGSGVVFTPDGAVVFFHGGEESRLISKTEFIASSIHTICGYSDGVSISSTGGECFIPSAALEFCDCINESGCDVLFLKFAKYFITVLWRGGSYTISSHAPCDSLEISRSGIAYSFSPATSCGIELSGRVDFSSVIRDISRGESLKFSSFTEKRCGNYSRATFSVSFFERVYCSSLSSDEIQEKLMAGYLASDIGCTAGDICEFLGDFCGIQPCPHGCVLFYSHGGGVFSCKKFNVETSGGSNLAVSNIVEVEEFALDNTHLDISSLFFCDVVNL